MHHKEKIGDCYSFLRSAERIKRRELVSSGRDTTVDNCGVGKWFNVVIVGDDR
jgi:hypothetical protein